MQEQFIHPLSDVASNEIGKRTRIWQFVVILKGAVVGDDCNICSHCFIESNVVIGDRVTVKAGVQLWNGLRIADDVFIGPNATFTNDRLPKSGNKSFQLLETVIEKGASIGANATILPGLTIGANATIGAGAVVTKNVPPSATVVGHPARIFRGPKNEVTL